MSLTAPPDSGISPEQNPTTGSLNPPVIINFASFIPVIHPAKYAELVGLSHDVVQGHIRNNYLPTVKQGRYRMINIVALSNQLAKG